MPGKAILFSTSHSHSRISRPTHVRDPAHSYLQSPQRTHKGQGCHLNPGQNESSHALPSTHAGLLMGRMASFFLHRRQLTPLPQAKELKGSPAALPARVHRLKRGPWASRSALTQLLPPQTTTSLAAARGPWHLIFLFLCVL